MISPAPWISSSTPNTIGTASAAAIGEPNSNIPTRTLIPSEDERSDTAAFKTSNDLKHAHGQPLNTKNDHNDGGDREGGNERMSQDKKAG